VPVERVEREHGDEATTLLLERKHGRGPGRGAVRKFLNTGG